MQKVIEAVFEDGVIKPLESLDLAEHQRLRVTISSLASAVAESQGMIVAPKDLVTDVAESDEYLPFCSKQPESPRFLLAMPSAT